jgi:hypothetical protein
MYHLINNVESNKRSNKVNRSILSSSTPSSPNVSSIMNTSSPNTRNQSSSSLKRSSPIESTKSKVLLKSNTTIITTTLTTNTQTSSPSNKASPSSLSNKASTKSQYYYQLSNDVKHSINIVINRLHYIHKKLLLYYKQRYYHIWKINIINIINTDNINIIHKSYQTQIRNEREYYIKELLNKDEEYKNNEICLKEYHKLLIYQIADIPKARIFMKTLERIFRLYDKRRAWNKIIVANIQYSEPVLVAAGYAAINEHNVDSINIIDTNDNLTKFEKIQARLNILSKHPTERIRSIRSLKRIIKRMKTAITSINSRTSWHDQLNFFHLWKSRVSDIINMEKIEKLKLEIRVKDNILSKFEDDVRNEMIRISPIIEDRERMSRQRITCSDISKIPTVIKDPNSIHKEKANDITKIVFENLRLYSAKKLFTESTNMDNK